METIVRKVENGLEKEISRQELFLEKEFNVKEVNLTKTTADELEEQRNGEEPRFVLKDGDELYETVIPKEISLSAANFLGKHKCGTPGHECRRLSAAMDEEGGCEKVRNRATFIEKYPWINLGYESFNCGPHDVLVVIECEHYEKCAPQKQKEEKS